jgi:hypothetical protein
MPGPPGTQLGGCDPESPPLPDPELVPEPEPLDDEEPELLPELPPLELAPDPELPPEPEPPLDEEDVASFALASVPWLFEPELPQPVGKPTAAARAAGTKRARPHVNVFPTRSGQRYGPRLSSGGIVTAERPESAVLASRFLADPHRARQRPPVARAQSCLLGCAAMSTAFHALRKQNSSTLAGQLAWGWRVSPEGQVERDEHEERIAAVARHMRASGATLREIVEFFQKDGVVGRRGTPIGMTRVFEMIHRGRAKPKSSPLSTSAAARQDLLEFGVRTCDILEMTVTFWG